VVEKKFSGVHGQRVKGMGRSESKIKSKSRSKKG
jgi:hypothetical protein